ncbi:MAG: pirin family protein [Pseudomonadales bacterium]|nr:pirin family protein [Pseudomonadales bacterium]
MISVRKADARGRSRFGWLDSRHSFSFGEYFDPQHMGFSALRVINDDSVTPGAGFGTHGHRDMEIISCVLDGVIAHKDSEGNSAELRPGEFQLMSAGSGIHHSEFNASATEPLHFLQIWIQPRVYGQAPGYQQQTFAQKPGLTLVASPDGAEDSMVLKQDARLYQLVLPADNRLEFSLSGDRKSWIHVIHGTLALAGQALGPGDGLAVEHVQALSLVAAAEPVRALVFDLP